MVLLILGAVWAAVLVPPALRARAESRPGDTIVHFHSQLNVLRKTGGFAPIPVPDKRAQVRYARARVPSLRARTHLVRKRRRDVLVGLLAAMMATLLLGMVPALRPLLVLHLVLDACFVAYVVVLHRLKNLASERARKVRYLPAPAPGVADLALRRASR